MFRTKKEVDRHVLDIFRKLQNEYEKTLRCFKIAELYNHVGDFDSAKRYLFRYLEVRKDAKAHKLMAQIYESLGQKNEALVHYKISYELDNKQNVILKVCELMADAEVQVDISSAKFWIELAENMHPYNKIIFQLKEKILLFGNTKSDDDDFEKLILAEIDKQKNNVLLKVKLLKHLVEKNKLEEAYKFGLETEATNMHRNSLIWYQVLSDVLLKNKNIKFLNWSFWIFCISTLERYIALCLKDQNSSNKKSVNCFQLVHKLDQLLFEAKAQCFSSHPSLTELIFLHMLGQLNFYLACLLICKAKSEKGNWIEVGQSCAPLFLTAMHIKPLQIHKLQRTSLETSVKSKVDIWYLDGCYRCSQSAHILQEFSRGNPKKLFKNIEKFCIGSWKERLYKKIFDSQFHQHSNTSYFMNNNSINPPLKFVTSEELLKFDEESEKVWPNSLNHQIWPGLIDLNITSSIKQNRFLPNLISNLFPKLNFSVSDFNQSSAATLCQLDVDAFLNAVAYSISAVFYKPHKKNSFCPNDLPKIPADLMPSLCSEVHQKWWKLIRSLYEKDEIIEDISETNELVRKGLEAVRCIGNHGLHLRIIIHLARIFNFRAQKASEEKSAALEARSEMYWSVAVSLLEKLKDNENICSTSNKFFDYKGEDLNNMESSAALEEGKLILARKFVKDKFYEEAIQSLEPLKCPEASFYQGKIYKILADKIIENISNERVTTDLISQRINILSKARNYFYLTLDRLRNPNTDPKHPLNADLCNYISALENELSKLDPESMCNHLVDRSYRSFEDDYSSAYVEDDQLYRQITDTGFSLETPQSKFIETAKFSTPKKRSQEINDKLRENINIRPSPERLDAQIRQLMHAVESLKVQQKETNKIILSKLDELMYLHCHNEYDKNYSTPISINKKRSDDFNIYSEENYRNYNYRVDTALNNSQKSVTPQNIFLPQQQHSYAPLVYPSSALQTYYHNNLPFQERSNQQIPTLYSSNFHNMPSNFQQLAANQTFPAIKQMSDTILLPGISANNLPNQSANLANMQNPSLISTLQKTDSVDLTTSSSKQYIVNTVTEAKYPNENVSLNVINSNSDRERFNQETQEKTNLENSFLAPHKYQISIPPQVAATSDNNLFHSTLGPSITSIKSNEHFNTQENYHTQFDLQDKLESSLETDHDPIPDFTPIIPLPEEVPINTGEEEETILYSGRAKLFRFVDREWKERGIGNVKLLRNVNGKIRLLMRREQILKICANHFLRKDMQLSPMQNNDKAYVWVAHDFADEEIKLEKLCIKFKTSEEANIFKEHFDEAIKNLTSEVYNETQKAIDKKYQFNDTVKNEIKRQSINKSLQEIDTNANKTENTLRSNIHTDYYPTNCHSENSFSKKDLKLQSIECNNHHTKIEENEIYKLLFLARGVTLFVYTNSKLNNTFFGKIKILHIKASGKMDLIILNEEESITYYEETFSTKIEFKFSNLFVNWSLEKENAGTKYLIEYKLQFLNSDQVQQFQRILTDCQQKNTDFQIQEMSNVKVPLSELFKSAAGSWECEDCYTRNNSNVSKCVACQAPKPHSVLKKSHDSQQSPNSSSLNNAKFKTLQQSTSFWECKLCHAKNSLKSVCCDECKMVNESDMKSTESTDDSLIFCDNKQSSEVISSVPVSRPFLYESSSAAFGNSFSNTPNNFFKKDSSKSTEGISNFNFGSPGKSFDFQFEVNTEKKLIDDSEVSDEEVYENEDIYFPPAIPLPEKIDVKTGEENESILYCQRAKLFKFCSDTKEWKERGLGDIKLLQHTYTMKLRLVMRREQIFKLCLNHNINESFEMSKKDDKTLMWYAGDFSEGEIEYSQFACRFKSSEIVDQFKMAIENAITKIKKKNFLRESSPFNEIEIIYEANVTPEEKESALKLCLPPNFYMYKNKKDCPGCIGCEELDSFSSETYFSNSKNNVKFGKTHLQIKNDKPMSEETNKASNLNNQDKKKSDLQNNSILLNIFSTPLNKNLINNTILIKNDDQITSKSSERPINLNYCKLSESIKDNNFDLGSIDNRRFDCYTSCLETNSAFDTTNINKINDKIQANKSIHTEYFECDSDVTKKKNESTNNLIEKKEVKTDTAINLESTKLEEAENVNEPIASGFHNNTNNESLNFNNKFIEESSKNEICFLPTKNSMTFSYLASQVKQDKPVFKADPSFAFEGAGASVFGKSLPNPKKSHDNTNSTNETNEKVDEINEENDSSEEQDPYFEPIVPLPEIIEVRTGEEDEIKLFCQRAKLYRFNAENREWKERGVGEMKVLYHSVTKRYRLLLRREQVFKIVCNMLLTIDLEFREHESSDKAWVWAGMNYSEEKPQIEKLAVKFKSIELAKLFKEVIDNAQNALQEKYVET